MQKFPAIESDEQQADQKRACEIDEQRSKRKAIAKLTIRRQRDQIANQRTSRAACEHQ